MDKGDILETARSAPDSARAILAVRLASDVLDAARQRYELKDFEGALESSRDSVRLSSSALLFRDGYISDTLDGTLDYLSHRYPGVFPLEGWRRMESAIVGGGRGLYAILMEAFGKAKKAGEEDARDAIAVASAFLKSAQSEMRI